MEEKEFACTFLSLYFFHAIIVKKTFTGKFLSIDQSIQHATVVFLPALATGDLFPVAVQLSHEYSL